MKLNINIPTRGRPEKLLKCLESIDYSGDHDIFLSCHDKMADLPELPEGHKYHIIEDKHALTIESHNKVCRNEGHFMGLSDDIVFHPGALDIAVWELEEGRLNGFGIIDFTVANMNAPDGCYMLLGDAFIDKFMDRMPYCPEYRFMFASAELRDYAKSINCFFKCSQAKLDHFHPAATGNPDETHTRVRSSGVIKNDRDNYERRRKAGIMWTHHPAR